MLYLPAPMTDIVRSVTSAMFDMRDVGQCVMWCKGYPLSKCMCNGRTTSTKYDVQKSIRGRKVFYKVSPGLALCVCLSLITVYLTHSHP